MFGRRAAVLLFLLLAIAFVALGVSIPRSIASTPSSAQAKFFTIEVGANGFNGTSGVLNVTVQQGDSVNITFVYADGNMSFNNPHAIMIDGYGVQTMNIDRSNPTVTVQFIADHTGTFKIYCYIPCDGMGNLQSARLIVTQGVGSAAPATSLSVTHTNTTPQTRSIIEATLQDQNGNPLVSFPVEFYENTTFGRLLLGTGTTDSAGIATFNYTSSRVGTVQIIAEFAGSLAYAQSTNSITITMPTANVEIQPGQTVYVEVRGAGHGLSNFYGIGYPANLAMIAVPTFVNILLVLLVGIIVGGVWSTYAYVGRQILNIREPTVPHPGVAAFSIPIYETTTQPIQTTSSNQFTLKQTLSLAFLLSMLGGTDVILSGMLEASILVRALFVIVLGTVEAAAIVAMLSHRLATD